MKSLINPFELLGINEKSTLKDARKAYYNIALLCHPDCGGDENSMRVLVNAYKFVEKQLKTVRNVSENIGKDLEIEFEIFNEQVRGEIPPLRDLFDLAHDDFHKKFNAQFDDDQKNRFEEYMTGNPFEIGYGNLMVDDKRDENDEEEKLQETDQVFSKEIIIYEEPDILPITYGNNFRLDIDKIKDFSEIQGELQMNDYLIAHRELENPPTSIKAKMDEPINNNDFEKMLEIRMKQRNDLLPHIKHKDIELKI